jgi:NAD(P)-dependent dehydrogenase (short-subunit alcohol dehydrogenase family)
LTPDGGVDHLIVNGAHVSKVTDFIAPSEYVGQEELFLSELQTSMSTNVAGALYSINAFLPLVKNSTTKKIIVLSTGLADTELFESAGMKSAVPYTMSKVAVNVLVAKYAIEFKEEGIQFLALSPGLVATSDLSKREFKNFPYSRYHSYFLKS